MDCWFIFPSITDAELRNHEIFIGVTTEILHLKTRNIGYFYTKKVMIFLEIKSPESINPES